MLGACLVSYIFFIKKILRWAKFQQQGNLKTSISIPLQKTQQSKHTCPYKSTIPRKMSKIIKMRFFSLMWNRVRRNEKLQSFKNSYFPAISTEVIARARDFLRLFFTVTVAFFFLSPCVIGQLFFS